MTVPRSIAAGALATGLVACGLAGTDPSRPRGIAIVAGDAVSDTAVATLAQPLTVEVRVNGVPRPSVVVRFEEVPPDDSVRHRDYRLMMRRPTRSDFTWVATDSTDAQGRAHVIVRLGSTAGPARVAVSVPELGFADTARYVVLPGNAASIRLGVRDTASLVGRSYRIAASVLDAHGNARAADVLTYVAASGAARVDAAGTVTADDFGRAAIAVTSGALRDTARVSVVPDFVLNVVVGGPTGASIGMVRTDGSGLTRLAPVTSEIMLPNATAAGTSVYYEGDPNSSGLIYSVDSLGNRRQILPTSASLSSMHSPRATASGSWVYFTGVVPRTGLSNALSGSAVFRVHLDGTGLERLSTGTGGILQTSPSPSPDGTKVIFVDDGVISTLDLATRSVTSLKINGSMPRYSPDGTRIVYQTGAPYTGPLWVANADGSNAQSFTSPSRSYAMYAAPDWSPDGKWIVTRMPGGPSIEHLELWRVSDWMMVELPFSLSISQPSFRPVAP